MRICYFYAQIFDTALTALPDDAELVDTSADNWAYWRSIVARWNSGEDILFVEQDIVITEPIVSELSSCRDWCTAGYTNGNPNVILTESLGCTRFSARFQSVVSIEKIICLSANLRKTCAAHPVQLSSGGFELSCTDSDYCWRHIDGPIATACVAAGIEKPHVHDETVEHLHYK